MVNYQQGKIYQIVNDHNDTIYIGSTCQSLNKRMAAHRAYAKKRQSELYSTMLSIGVHQFNIVLICDYPCSSKEELFSKESFVMKKFPKKNTKLYNCYVDGTLTLNDDNVRKKLRSTWSGRKHSEKTKFLMSKGSLGRPKSQAHRQSLSASKLGRGSVFYGKSRNVWGFAWYPEPGKQKSKVFSIKKYGSKKAKELAEQAQDEMYPK